MGAVNNVIELVFKVRDQTASQINAIRNKVTSSTTAMHAAGQKLEHGFDGLKEGFAEIAIAAVGVASVVGVLHKVVEASAETEIVLKRLEIAFRNIGGSSGKTREELVKFAEETSKTSIFDDESIIRAETSLLKFRKISGDTFDRVRKDAIDLASATGGDLVSAMELLGRSVERPEIAIRRLRAAGIIFSADQEKMIRALTETGQRAKAAEIILAEVEHRVKGAGDEIAHTLTGALARLKHGWDDLFKTDTAPLTAAVSDLADVINNPEFRKNMRELAELGIRFLAGTAQAANAAASAWQDLMDRSANWQAHSQNPFSSDFWDTEGFDAIDALSTEFNAQQKVIEDVKSQIAEYNKSIADGREVYVGYRDELLKTLKIEEAYSKTLRQRMNIQSGNDSTRRNAAKFQEELNNAADTVISGIVSGKAPTDTENQMEGLKEVVVGVFKASTSAMSNFYDQLDARTQTSSQKETQGFYEFKASLDELYQRNFDALNDSLSKGTISWEEYHRANLKLNADYNSRFGAALEDTLSEVQVTVKKVAIPAMKTAWDAMYDTFADATDRMLNNGRFTWRELGQYLLREVETGAIKKALDALRSAIKNAMKGSSSGGGFFSDFIGGLFGAGSSGAAQPAGRAGGGLIPKSGAWLGENGPEFAMGPGMVYNAETMKAMLGSGGGSKVTFAPVTQLTIQGDAREKEVSAILSYIDSKNNQTQKLFLQMLERQNVKRPR